MNHRVITRTSRPGGQQVEHSLGTVVYEPSLGPAGQGGAGLPEPGAPGTYLVGRFSIVVR
jgi:hypothetical protein